MSLNNVDPLAVLFQTDEQSNIQDPLFNILAEPKEDPIYGPYLLSLG